MELRDAGDAVAGAAGDRFAGAFAWAAEPARAPAGSGGLVEFVEQGVGFVVEAFGAVQVVVVFGVGQVDVELTESVAVAARAVAQWVGTGVGWLAGGEGDGGHRRAGVGEQGRDVGETFRALAYVKG
jgi:hypothetical protein